MTRAAARPTIFAYVYVGPSLGGVLVPGEVRYFASPPDDDPAWVRLDGARLDAADHDDLAIVCPEWLHGDEIRLPRVVLPVES